MADLTSVYTITGNAASLVSAAGQGEAALGKLEGTGSRVGNVFSGALNVGMAAAATGVAAFAAGIGASISAATGFERSISSIGAVAGASAQQMQQISAVALQLGKDTSFSASQAAAGMEELLKAGVAIPDVLNGGAQAMLNLAAAGGVAVPEAATIMSTAMNTFSIAGDKAAHVSDLLAGAANASAIDIHDLGFSLSAVGAVANTVGLSLDDTTTAIALLGQAGLKGSDAGTSLKTLLINLTPSSNRASDAMRELGIITADGSNRFFDAAGHVKSFAEISEVLHDATKDLTEQERLHYLQVAFGTDAVRAAAIAAKGGAVAVNEMADAMSHVAAADVANQRLNNLSGDIEVLKGSLETAAITVGTAFLPALRSLTQAATTGVNEAIVIFQKLPAAWEEIKKIFTGETVSAGNVVDILAVFGLSTFTADLRNIVRQAGDIWRTLPQAFKGDWEPSSTVDPIVNAIGTIATAAGKVPPAIDTIVTKVGELAGINLDGASGPWEKLGIVVSDSAAKISAAVDKFQADADRATQQTGKSTQEINDFWLSANGITDTSSGGITAALGRLADAFVAAMQRVNTEGTQSYNETWMGANGIVVGTDRGAGGVLAALDGWVRDFAAAVARVNTEGAAPYNQFWMDANGVTVSESGNIVTIIDGWSRQIGETIARANQTDLATINQFWTDANGASTQGTSVVGQTISTWWETITSGWSAWATNNNATLNGFWTDANGGATTGTSVIGSTIAAWWAEQQAGWAQWGADTVAAVQTGLTNAVAAVTGAAASWLAAGQALGQSIVDGVTSALAGLAAAVLGPIQQTIQSIQSTLSGLSFSAPAVSGGGAQMMSYRPAGGGGGSAHANQYLPLINQIAAREGEDPALIAALVATEASGTNSVSTAGARGIMQVVPGQGFNLPGEDASDPATSIMQGIRAIRAKRAALGPGASPADIAGAYFGYGTDSGGMTTGGYRQRFQGFYNQYNQPGPSPSEMQKMIPGQMPSGWTPQDLQDIIDLAPPWERAMETIQTSGQTAFETVTTAGQTMSTDTLTSVTSLGDGMMTTFQDASGTTIATVTDLSGNVTSQIAQLSNGVTLTMGDMANGVITSTTDLGNGVLTVMQDTSGNVIATTTDLAGNVTAQWTQLGANVNAAAGTMAAGATAQTQAMSSGVTTETQTMATAVLQSVTDLGNGLTQTIVTTAQGTVATIQDWSGQVIGVYTETESQTSAAVDTMASNADTAMQAVASSSDIANEALGTVQDAFKETGGAAKSAAPPVKEFASAAASVRPINMGDSVKNIQAVEKAALSAAKAIDQLNDKAGKGGKTLGKTPGKSESQFGGSKGGDSMVQGVSAAAGVVDAIAPSMASLSRMADTVTEAIGGPNDLIGNAPTTQPIVTEPGTPSPFQQPTPPNREVTPGQRASNLEAAPIAQPKVVAPPLMTWFDNLQAASGDFSAKLIKDFNTMVRSMVKDGVLLNRQLGDDANTMRTDVTAASESMRVETTRDADDMRLEVGSSTEHMASATTTDVLAMAADVVNAMSDMASDGAGHAAALGSDVVTSITDMRDNAVGTVSVFADRISNGILAARDPSKIASDAVKGAVLVSFGETRDGAIDIIGDLKDDVPDAIGTATAPSVAAANTLGDAIMKGIIRDVNRGQGDLADAIEKAVRKSLQQAQNRATASAQISLPAVSQIDLAPRQQTAVSVDIDYARLAQAIVKAGAKISDRNYNLTLNTAATEVSIPSEFNVLEAMARRGES